MKKRLLIAFIYFLFTCTIVAKEKENENNNFKEFITDAFPRPNFSIAADAGYTVMGNKYGTSQGYIGGILGFSNEVKNTYHGRTIHQVFLGAGINYGRYNSNKTEVLPTFSVAYTRNYLYSRVAVSKYHVLPSVGLNIFNVIQIHLGYSYGYKRKNGIRLSGPTLSINLNLGINHMVDLSN